MITGTAGFIGFHLSKTLLDMGYSVLGIDNYESYYDVSLKRDRTNILKQNNLFQEVEASILDQSTMETIFQKFTPEVVIHLAGQAGVRYSLENPRAYLNANINGTFELLDLCKKYKPKHLMLASSSSVYGECTEVPFKENQKTDCQVSFYASTKKVIEVMAHSYSHLYSIPVTCFRFFTVYGPWGRPDMAPLKFMHAIMQGKSIDVYNNGDMLRDFTYIDDLVKAIKLLIPIPPVQVGTNLSESQSNYSTVAPFRVVNIGNSKPVKLMDFINVLESVTSRKADLQLKEMQAGDVKSTFSDTRLLHQLTGFAPQVSLQEGAQALFAWYSKYYNEN